MKHAMPRTISYCLRLVFCLFLLATQASQAGNLPMNLPLIRTQIAPASVIVGQPVTLSIAILVPTWFTGPIDYPLDISIPDAIAKLSDERPINLNENIDGQSWAGMSRNYLIQAQKGGRFTIPSFVIHVPYSGADGQARTVDVKTAALDFTASMPAGFEKLGYQIVTPDFKLTQQWDRDARAMRTLKVGDTLARRIVMQAENLAPMFLPPLHFDALPGIEVYPDESRPDETVGQRGEKSTGSRIDSATYLFTKPGKYRLPGVRIAWFDPVHGKLRWAEVAELAFDVAPNPAFENQRKAEASAQPAAKPPSLYQRIKLLLARTWRQLLGVLIAGGMLLWLAQQTLRQLRLQHARWLNSERRHFRRCCQVVAGGDAKAALQAIYDWLKQVAPANQVFTLEQFVATFGDADLRTQIQALQAGLYATGQTDAWAPKQLRLHLQSARRRCLKPNSETIRGAARSVDSDRTYTQRLLSIR